MPYPTAVALRKIRTGRNPRTYLDSVEMAEITKSIRAPGVYQPINPSTHPISPHCRTMSSNSSSSLESSATVTSLAAELRLGITMKKLPVDYYLTLSAFHLSEETFCCFGQEPVLANNFASYFVEVINVYAPSARHYAIPEDLEKVMQYAMSLGITLLHFDVRADEIEVLPRYEWS